MHSNLTLTILSLLFGGGLTAYAWKFDPSRRYSRLQRRVLLGYYAILSVLLRIFFGFLANFC